MTKSSISQTQETQVATPRTHTTLGPLGRLKGLNSYASDVGLACLVYPDVIGQDTMSQRSMGAVTRLALKQSASAPRDIWRATKKIPNKMEADRPHLCCSQGDGPTSLFIGQDQRVAGQSCGDFCPLDSPGSVTATFSRLSTISSSGDDSQLTTAYSRQCSSRTSWNSEMERCPASEFSSANLKGTVSALQRFFHEPVVGVILAIQYFSLVVVLCFIGFSEPGMFGQ